MYRTDEIEMKLRKRALHNAIVLKNKNDFMYYNKGYVQALKDMKLDENYIEIYNEVSKRVKKAYSVKRVKETDEN